MWVSCPRGFLQGTSLRGPCVYRPALQGTTVQRSLDRVTVIPWNLRQWTPSSEKESDPGNHSPQSFFVNTEGLPKPRGAWLTDAGAWRLLESLTVGIESAGMCWSLSGCKAGSVFDLQGSFQPSGVNPRAVTGPRRNSDPINLHPEVRHGRRQAHSGARQG